MVNCLKKGGRYNTKKQEQVIFPFIMEEGCEETEMLLSISITLIFLITGIIVYYTYLKRKYLSPMTGMIVSMTNSTMTSMSFGTILGILIQDKGLTFPTMIAVSIGMIVGYITGKPISLIASLDGITAGIMGGMMGTMLGIMLQPNSTQIMIFFIDIIYILVTVLLLRVIDQDTKTNQNENSKKTFIG